MLSSLGSKCSLQWLSPVKGWSHICKNFEKFCNCTLLMRYFEVDGQLSPNCKPNTMQLQEIVHKSVRGLLGRNQQFERNYEKHNRANSTIELRVKNFKISIQLTKIQFFQNLADARSVPSQCQWSEWQFITLKFLKSLSNIFLITSLPLLEDVFMNLMSICILQKKKCREWIQECTTFI